MQQLLFTEEKTLSFEGFVLPDVSKIDDSRSNIPTFLWDIPNTIKELSYLTHSHYRYYGKFPSAVAGQLLEQYKPPTKEHYVLDNFCGSGTTLVEAKLRNINSYGVDISWISALVSRVKCRHIDLKKVEDLLSTLPKDLNLDNGANADSAFAQKWFTDETILQLSHIQHWLLQLSPCPERDFMLVAFLAIIRRVSKAFDAEVRPHINKSKKEREVRNAFTKKVMDMLTDHQDFQTITSPDINAECFVANNLHLPSKLNDGKCYLVVSHPPYLNSFNYRPVFSLEFFWGAPFEAEYRQDAAEKMSVNELIAHPATEENTEKYFAHLKRCFEESARIQTEGGKLAVVIGDCTRNGKLIPVLDRTVSIVEEIGYKLVQKNLRTTHYGLGKYAYKHRADYHGEEEEKRDGILVFSRK